MQLVDLSNNNPGPLNFGAVKGAGIAGVWLKATEGLTFVDHDFKARAEAARMVGLRVGGYHFARPEPGTAVREATFFATVLGRVERRDLRPVLDLEVAPAAMHGEELRLWARSFLAHVHSLAGVLGLTYSSPGFLASQAWTETVGTGAGLWLADYGPNDGREHPHGSPHPWRRIVAHQYTSRGHVAGVPGEVDRTRVVRRRGVLAHPIRGAF